MAKTRTNTLEYDESKCNNCGTCTMVCPHGVFHMGADKVLLVAPDACMECGACALNCTRGAIKVDSSVGCAAAMIKAALTGGEATCDCAADKSCC